ncbi:FtsX-like permease family protein [Mangrovicoccus algicola]|uniref:FtsX-like permease family protein n=1 Tax=Mangrovicoccus algicola TaxID=2771008 RepID=A0A8J6YZ07_9RHOB|nr:FtsX-like permease family protein [Mangrovicoccus algicola]MBE3640210.1 FtsX-like permease family protein [Mangrovicoccus algicola]
MSDLWAGLPVLAQDVLVTLALLAPVALCALLLLRGFAPLPLIRAVLWRFRWANLMFVLLIAVSVGMGIGVIAQERGLRRGMAMAADKFDLVISAPGSEMTMMLATVFLQPSDVPLLDGATYDEIARHETVDIAAPLAFGDSYGDSPVVGTTAEFVTYLGDGALEGRMWQAPGEAIAGAAAAADIGDSFTPSHGSGASAEAHEGASYTVVGRLPRSGTPWDRAILVPVEAVWQIHGLADGHAPERAGQLGPPFDPDYFPGTPAVLVHADALWANYALKSEFTRDAETMAFFPGTVLSQLYRVMGDVRQVMSLMTVVTQILVAASVLLGLFILTRLFRRQTAMLRALGAPARFVMAVVWSYGAALLAAGTVLGLGAGLAAAAILSRIVTLRTDVLVEAAIGWSEIHLAAGFLAATCLLSLLPALVVLRQPVAEGLRA